MNIRDVKINIIPKKVAIPAEYLAAPLMDDDLIKAEGYFRKRINTTLQRACERKIEVFEMSGLDNRFLNFPVIGAAKIVSQEILRMIKDKNNCFKEIQVLVPDEEIFMLYKSTVEGYLKHIEHDLGEGPYYTVDIIIEPKEGIILIERSNPPYGWALPGGFIDSGEEPLQAAIREAKEETNMDLEDIREFGVYDQKDRDPRFQTISTVFIATGVGKPQFGDDAKGLQIIEFSELLKRRYAFDHKQIISDYLKQKRK